jgi:hypothetical protein
MTYRLLTIVANSQKMKELLSDEDIFVVPTVIPEMSSKKGTRRSSDNRECTNSAH